MSRAEVVALQRSAGNAAVSALIARPGGRPASPAAPRLQRAVGFEFQTGWGVIQPPGDDGKRKKYKKGELLHDYTRFKATADEQTGTELGAELEWVVDPPIEEREGAQAVQQVMAALDAEAKKLLAFKDRDSFRMSDATGDPTDAGVEMHPGIVSSARGMTANPQVTMGVGMAHLHELLGELGRPGTKDESKDVLDVLTRHSGGDPFARAADAGARVQGSQRLKGLVGMLSRYLEMGMPPLPGRGGRNANWKHALEYAKASTLVLARTDFAQMFRMLPREERTAYADDPDSLVKLVLDAEGDRLDPDADVLERGIKGARPQGDQEGEVLFITVTRREWLTGITQHKDLLSSKGMPGLKPELESMGSLGAATDKQTEEKPGGGVGKQGRHRGVVVELREAKQQMPPGEWAKFALDVFNYVVELNARHESRASRRGAT